MHVKWASLDLNAHEAGSVGIVQLLTGMDVVLTAPDSCRCKYWTLQSQHMCSSFCRVEESFESGESPIDVCRMKIIELTLTNIVVGCAAASWKSAKHVNPLSDHK